MTDDRGNSGVEGSDPARPQLIDRLRPYTRKPDVVTLLVGLAIGLAVCGPLMGGGRVFFLDWSIGAHFPVVSVGSLGLDGGLTSGVAASYIVAVLNPILGGSVTWIPILLFFPIAVVGAGRLAGGSNWTRVSAGLFYAVNPFVFSRLFVGHIPLLIGYALLPFATIATITSVASRFRRWPVPSLWWAGLTALESSLCVDFWFNYSWSLPFRVMEARSSASTGRVLVRFVRWSSSL